MYKIINIVLISTAFSAFEWVEKQDLLSSTSLHGEKISMSYIQPFGLSFLQSSHIKSTLDFSIFSYHPSLFYLGDSLYNEFQFSQQISIPLDEKINFILTYSYSQLHIATWNTYSQHSLSGGGMFQPSPNIYIKCHVKNLYQYNTMNILPIHIQLSSGVFHKYAFIFGFTKTLPYSTKLFFQSSIPIVENHMWASVGYLGLSSEIIFSLKLTLKNMSIHPFTLLHPQLGQSFGLQFSYH
jgi:hypothetical protein